MRSGPQFFSGIAMDNTQLDDSVTAATMDRPSYPGLLPTIGFIVLYFVLQAVCTGLIMAATQGSGAMPVIIIFGLVAAAIVQLFLMWLYLRKQGRMAILGLNNFGKIPLREATALAVILVIAAMAFNYIYATYVIPGVGMQEEMAKILASIPRTPVNIAAIFFAIAIAAPIVEELLFRGLLQNAVAKYVPFWAAILLSSFLFAVVHMQLYAIPGLMSLSIAFGYLYHRTGSLRTNIILHMANNAFALFVSQILN
jgi:membrane protease YdiL (CAAX protease family)